MLLVDIAYSLLKRVGFKIYVAIWYCLVSLGKHWIQNQCERIKCAKQKQLFFFCKTYKTSGCKKTSQKMCW